MSTLEEDLSSLKDGRSWESLICSSEGTRHYDKVDNESKNCNYELCKTCGGRCCKRCGCCFSPDDFDDLSFDGLLKEIQKGYITLKLVDGDQFYIPGFIWLVRMRNIDSPVVERSRSTHERSGCIALKENGCAFDYAHRPAGGRLLIPRKKESYYDCYGSYSTEVSLREWRMHQEVLAQLAHFIEGTNYPCTI